MLIATADRDAPVDGGDQFPAPALLQVSEADGDDEEGFEAFAEGDDERLNHVSVHARRTLNEIESQDAGSVYSRDIRPVKSGIGDSPNPRLTVAVSCRVCLRGLPQSCLSEDCRRAVCSRSSPPVAQRRRRATADLPIGHPGRLALCHGARCREPPGSRPDPAGLRGPRQRQAAAADRLPTARTCRSPPS